MQSTSKLRRLLPRLGLSIASLMVFALLLEFVVFRYVLVAPSVPRVAYSNGVLRYQPNQSNPSRDPAPPYRYNAQGWNSGYESYSLERPAGVRRIVIIGDSYVNARQVPYDESVAEVLERELGTDEFQVYRFGMEGVPLTQYLHVLRVEAQLYKPDLAVVVLIHNDFLSSYNRYPGAYPTSFLRLRIDGDSVEEIQPEPFEPIWWYPLVKGTAIYRYFVTGNRINVQGIKDFLNARRVDKEVFQANINVSRLENRGRPDALATSYVFRELRELADELGIELLVVMDGDRGAIYKDLDTKELYTKGALRLNAMSARIAREHGLPFIDLHPIFERDYREKHIKFNSAQDGHWDEYGHQLAAREIQRYIEQTFPSWVAR